MRLVFVCYPFEDQGSGLVLQGYAEAAQALGHEAVVYACPYDKIPLNYSLEVGAADAIVFLFEWTTKLYYGDQLDLARLVGKVPRARRIVIDGDGNYNAALRAGIDANHPDADASRRWIEMCDSLSDKICQPTLHPLRPNVLPFLFYAYNPEWERPLEFGAKEFGLLYVGHSKYRWPPMERVLRALEPVRGRAGRLGLVGHGWKAPPEWASRMGIEGGYSTNPAYLRRLDVEILPAVPFGRVVDWMSKAILNPVLVRPLFSELRLVTPRFFETPAAGTIPLFVLDEGHVAEIYGPEALELRLPDREPQEKLLDLLGHPERYADLLTSVRRRLAQKHSHRARLRRLLEIVES